MSAFNREYRKNIYRGSPVLSLFFDTFVFTLHICRNNRKLPNSKQTSKQKTKICIWILAKHLTKMSFSQPLQRFVTLCIKILNEKCYFSWWLWWEIVTNLIFLMPMMLKRQSYLWNNLLYGYWEICKLLGR